LGTTSEAGCSIIPPKIFVAATRQIRIGSAPTRRVGLLQNYFYFSMSLLIAAPVVYGFSHTVNGNLIRPTTAGPFILYLHAQPSQG
jgi:hypothetical protein